MVTRWAAFALATSLAAATCAAPPASTPGQVQAGSAERIAIAAYRQTKWPPIEQGIRRAAGFDVPIDVEWDQIAISRGVEHYGDDEFFGTTIFQPLTSALRYVAADPEGRDALRAKLRRIHVRYDERTAPASAYEQGVSLYDGTLDINWQPYANTSDVQPRIEALTQVIHKAIRPAPVRPAAPVRHGPQLDVRSGAAPRRRLAGNRPRRRPRRTRSDGTDA